MAEIIVQFAKEWHEANLVMNCKPARETVQLKWHSPQAGRVKTNVDGRYKSGEGKTTAGGLLRDSNGDWLGGFSVNIGAVWRQNFGDYLMDYNLLGKMN